ncbi:cutinase family protein [Embleya sp. NPDC050493]|uniref:cutinase family protein n=1 Tax=Embleya sp. NPDC050493 TaxID=3363989 RepID=UPI0037AAFC75
MTTRAARSVRILLTGALILLLSGLTSLQMPMARAATTDCAPFAILGSRGSGQLLTDQNGFGQPVYSFIQSFKSKLPASVANATTTWANPYDAVSVDGVGSAVNAASASLGRGPYVDSVQRGESYLRSKIKAIRDECAGVTKIILAGFSQGGQASGNVYQSLDASQLSDIFGVVLFGDPLFNPLSQRAAGDFDPERVGVLAHPASRIRAEFPDAANGKVLSYCHLNDGVCQGFVSFRPFKVSGVTAHSTYHTQGDAADPTPYAARAAQYFANRAGSSVTPGWPTAAITPVPPVYAGRPFLLSGAASFDPTGLALGYAWDLDNSGIFPAPSAAPSRSAVFDTPGTYTVQLRVTNQAILSNITSTVITVVADPGPGAPEAPVSLTKTPSADGESVTLAWQPPTSGPPVKGYEVFTSDGIPLAEIAGSSGSVKLLTAVLPETVYIQSVDDDSEGGSLTSTGSPMQSTNATVDGPDVSVTTTQAGMDANFSFRAQAGQTIYVNGTLIRNSNWGTNHISLLDPSGDVVWKAGFLSLEGPQHLTPPTTLSKSGTYTLHIATPAADSGKITVRVLGTIAKGSTILDGPPVSVTAPADQPGQRATVTFPGQAGQTVYINGSTPNNLYGCEFELYDPAGNRVASGEAATLNWGQLLLPVKLTSTGTYTVMITPSPTLSGTTSLQVLQSILSTSAIVNGPPVSLTVPPTLRGELAYITFVGQAGQTIRASGKYIGSDPKWRISTTLYDTADVSLGYSISGVFPTMRTIVNPIILPTTGIYTIKIAPDSSGTITVQIYG